MFPSSAFFFLFLFFSIKEPGKYLKIENKVLIKKQENKFLTVRVQDKSDHFHYVGKNLHAIDFLVIKTKVLLLQKKSNNTE